MTFFFIELLDKVSQKLYWAPFTMPLYYKKSPPYLSCEQVDDLKGMLDDADSHQLLAIVTPMHHETARQALHNGALGLAEALHLVTPR